MNHLPPRVCTSLLFPILLGKTTTKVAYKTCITLHAERKQNTRPVSEENPTRFIFSKRRGLRVNHLLFFLSFLFLFPVKVDFKEVPDASSSDASSSLLIPVSKDSLLESDSLNGSQMTAAIQINWKTPPNISPNRSSSSSNSVIMKTFVTRASIIDDDNKNCHMMTNKLSFDLLNLRTSVFLQLIFLWMTRCCSLWGLK